MLAVFTIRKPASADYPSEIFGGKTDAAIADLKADAIRRMFLRHPARLSNRPDDAPGLRPPPQAPVPTTFGIETISVAHPASLPSRASDSDSLSALGGPTEFHHVNRSQKWGAPILKTREERRDKFLDPYFRKAKPVGPLGLVLTSPPLG